MTVKIIHKTAGDNFNVKASMLGIDIDKQVELLNKIYDGDIIFKKYTGDYGEEPCTIMIDSFDNTADKIILPETPILNVEHLFEYSFTLRESGLTSIELPKCLKSINFYRVGWVQYIKRLFIHEETDFQLGDVRNSRDIKLSMIIILPKDSNKKAKLIRC